MSELSSPLVCKLRNTDLWGSYNESIWLVSCVPLRKVVNVTFLERCLLRGCGASERRRNKSYRAINLTFAVVSVRETGFEDPLGFAWLRVRAITHSRVAGEVQKRKTVVL